MCSGSPCTTFLSGHAGDIKLEYERSIQTPCYRDPERWRTTALQPWALLCGSCPALTPALPRPSPQRGSARPRSRFCRPSSPAALPTTSPSPHRPGRLSCLVTAVSSPRGSHLKAVVFLLLRPLAAGGASSAARTGSGRLGQLLHFRHSLRGSHRWQVRPASQYQISLPPMS